MCTSSRMQEGVLLRATANSAAPSAKQITWWPPADRTIERVSRTAGSSSTTNISPLEKAFSVILSSIDGETDAHSSNRTTPWLDTDSIRPYLYGTETQRTSSTGGIKNSLKESTCAECNWPPRLAPIRRSK